MVAEGRRPIKRRRNEDANRVAIARSQPPLCLEGRRAASMTHALRQPATPTRHAEDDRMEPRKEEPEDELRSGDPFRVVFALAALILGLAASLHG
jgi:hypothetical protein